MSSAAVTETGSTPLRGTLGSNNKRRSKVQSTVDRRSLFVSGPCKVMRDSRLLTVHARRQLLGQFGWVSGLLEVQVEAGVGGAIKVRVVAKGGHRREDGPLER